MLMKIGKQVFSMFNMYQKNVRMYMENVQRVLKKKSSVCILKKYSSCIQKIIKVHHKNAKHVLEKWLTCSKTYFIKCPSCI